MLGRVIDHAAEQFGDATALVAADGWPVSFTQLARRSQEVAAGLARRGVGPGDVVALVLPAIPEYTVAYLAAARLGAVTAGVNARLSNDERHAVLTRSDPAVVVATADLLPPDTVVPTAERVEVEPAGRAADLLAPLAYPGGDVPVLPDDPDRPVAVVFTSGTTGLPKGAVFGGRQLAFITEVDTGGRWGGGGPSIAGTSLTHLGPMTKLAGNLMRGGATHLLHRWRADLALDLVERHRMPGLGGIPTQIALMLRQPDFGDRDLSCVRAIVMGGGPATPSLVREARARFGAAVAVRYSCTEAGIGVGTALDDPPEDAELTVGRPHGGVELTIRHPESGDELTDGSVGEVCLRSPAVMSGYWRDPAATRAALTADGAVRTGDLGRIDTHGRLHLEGRAREMYVRGGYNVAPAVVEAALAEVAGVAEVAVAPRPDEVMGEIGVAVVVPEDGHPPPTLEQLRTAVAGRLARHELPEALELVDRLPLTSMEKLDRRALARLAQDAATSR